MAGKKKKSFMLKAKLQNIRLILPLLLLLLLPIVYFAANTVQQLLTQASGTKANIEVDTTHTLEPIKTSWMSFSQGGEEPKDMIAPVVSDIKPLNPRYIRIDHLYDHHPVVSRSSGGSLSFNFARIDAIVDSILATGAKPFFALSYMPQAIASGDITSIPRDWNEWALVVQKTIERYSGQSGYNLTDVYYEVWNEPDLFGGWKYAGPKNYLTLYTYAAQGAQNAQNTNSFKLGGPATTQLYKNWIVAIADHVTKNKLRFDFFSWHRYTTDPTHYGRDVAEVTSWLFPYPTLVTLPRVISEWGFDSDINPGYDGNLGAAHSVATVRQALNGYDQLFAFEVVDGPDPAGKKFWGRWGLITHPTMGKQKKPRYAAFSMLSELKGTRLYLKGEGTWVTGVATREDQTFQLLLSNYDLQGRNSETVPVRIAPLRNGSYMLTTTRLSQKPITTTIEVSEEQLQTEIIMTPNEVVLLNLVLQAEKNPFLGS